MSRTRHPEGRGAGPRSRSAADVFHLEQKRGLAIPFERHTTQRKGGTEARRGGKGSLGKDRGRREGPWQAKGVSIPWDDSDRRWTPRRTFETKSVHLGIETARSIARRIQAKEVSRARMNSFHPMKNGREEGSVGRSNGQKTKKKALLNVWEDVRFPLPTFP